MIYFYVCISRNRLSALRSETKLFSDLKVVHRESFCESSLHYLQTLTAIKLSPLSVANARATIVLLQPGGPYSRTPFGGLMPSLENAFHVYVCVFVCVCVCVSVFVCVCVCMSGHLFVHCLSVVWLSVGDLSTYLWVFEWPFYRFLHSLFHLFLSANVTPMNLQ